MLRRSILTLSRQRFGIRRVPRQANTQIPSLLRCQRNFSSVPPSPGSTNKPSGARNNFSKVLVGGVAIGTCLIAAYSGGYLDDVLGKKKQSSTDPLNALFPNRSTDQLPKDDGASHSTVDVQEPISLHTSEGSESQDPLVEKRNESTGTQSSLGPDGDPSNLKPDEAYAHAQVEESTKISGEQTSPLSHEADDQLSTVTDSGAVIQGKNIDESKSLEPLSQIEPKDLHSNAPEQATSLLNTYSLKEDVGERDSSSSEPIKQSSPKEEIAHGAFEDLSDAYVSKDGKLILDFLQAIHAAEQRQSELDARVHSEEKRALREKYEKELKDARARELMYAEEVAMLEKEINKERAKAASALKSLQERAEERLKLAIEEKEREAESKVKELQDFAQAELASSIAREKAAQIERMTEANLNINALCMAFYARSEEARQTHSVHKLALGALALEDALSNGLPVQAELDALGVYIEAVDKDSLLQLAVSSLPEDVRLRGTDSLLQLNQKFDALKGTLRHFSLIPPNGGGMLSHSLAHVASWLKVKEADQSGDSVESVINKVESLLAQGKLVEAAETLEEGVKDSKASEVVTDWLRRARNRAIAEQALVLLQSYATSMSLT